MRNIADLSYWKASEFRLFLLYCGVVVLHSKSVMPEFKYNLFLEFSVAMRMMLSASAPTNEVCSDLLKKFVNKVKFIYGKGFISYNVHSLVHLHEDLKNYGSLEHINCFPFESYLGLLKSYVRSGYQPLQQVSFRAFYENEKLHIKNSTGMQVLEERTNGNGIPVPGYSTAKSYKKVNLHNGCVIVAESAADSFIACGSIIGQVIDIQIHNNQQVLIFKRFTSVRNFFNYPVPSMTVGIYAISDLCSECEILPLSKYLKRCMVIPHKNYAVALEIIHAVC